MSPAETGSRSRYRGAVSQGNACVNCAAVHSAVGCPVIVELKAIVRLPLGAFASWSGLTPDNEPQLSRDISSQEIYSLNW